MKIKEKSKSRKILFLDTSKDETLIAVFDDRKLLEIISWNGNGELSDTLLAKIELLFRKNHLKLGDISLIAINLGPGSYTGLRIGISTVNAISWSNKIPIRSAKYENNKLAFLSTETLKSVLPLYAYPPNITKKKKINV